MCRFVGERACVCLAARGKQSNPRLRPVIRTGNFSPGPGRASFTVCLCCFGSSDTLFFRSEKLVHCQWSIIIYIYKKRHFSPRTWLQNDRFLVKFMAWKETGSSAVKLIKLLMRRIKTKLVKTVSMSHAVVLHNCKPWKNRKHFYFKRPSVLDLLAFNR